MSKTIHTLMATVVAILILLATAVATLMFLRIGAVPKYSVKMDIEPYNSGRQTSPKTSGIKPVPVVPSATPSPPPQPEAVPNPWTMSGVATSAPTAKPLTKEQLCKQKGGCEWLARLQEQHDALLQRVDSGVMSKAVSEELGEIQRHLRSLEGRIDKVAGMVSDHSRRDDEQDRRMNEVERLARKRLGF